MRQIYTSPRFENVTRVVELLNDAGIETHLSNRPSFMPGKGRGFSYRNSEAGDWPAVWIVRSEDQTRARQLLHECGLDPVGRFSDDLAVARSAASTKQLPTTALRIRLAVLAVTGTVALVLLLKILGVL